MPLFAAWGRRQRTLDRVSAEGATGTGRQELPARFRALAEALVSAGGAEAACTVAGEGLAGDGASLEEALTGLRRTCREVTGEEPAFGLVLAVGAAWAETVLRHLNQASCEDPLTGLAAPAHLRSRLSELHRAAGADPARPPVRETHALVLLEVAADVAEQEDPWQRALRLVGLGEAARTVFAGGESVTRLGARRVGVLARRDARLGQRVALLRQLAGAVADDGQPVRTWIEGLPATDDATGLLLDELARG